MNNGQDENDVFELIDDKRRELLLLTVVQHQLAGCNVTEACRLSNISTDQYYRWAKEGHLLTAYQSASRDLGPAAYEVLAPYYRQVLTNIARVASGLPILRQDKETGDILSSLPPSINNMLKAAQLFLQIMPPPSMGDKAADVSAAKILHDFVPQHVHVQHTHEFIYRESGTETRMGNLPSIAGDIIEGESFDPEK